MTQRRLEEEAPPEPGEAEEPGVPEPLPSSPSGVETAPVRVPPDLLRDPCDTDLRKRQAAWNAERARHEAHLKSRRVEAPASTEPRS
jgi:hypothetical protein